MGCCCKKRRYQWPYRYYYPPYPVMPNFPAEMPAVFIRDNEIDVWFAGVLFERHVDGLVFQYDKGLKLNIRGLDKDSITAVEFTRKDTPDSAVSYDVELVDPSAEEDSSEGQGDDVTPVDPDGNDVTPDTDPDSGNAEPEEPAQETEEEPADPEKLPYFSVAIPDELLTTPGQVIAYCVYKNEDGEYRTVKAVYLTVHERQALKVEDGSSDDGCGCDDKIAALEATIAELAAKVEELTNNAGG